MAPEREVEDDNVEENNTSTKRIKLDQKPTDFELSEKISRQLDYYFSDVNIVDDKFLLEEFKKEDGWVKLKVLMTFSKLKNLSTDEDRIIKAIKEVEPETIKLDESKRQVQRKQPLPSNIEQFKKELSLRTVHISGFPTDYHFEILKGWCGQFGEVESVQMRRHFKTRFFKGCIHVTFKNKEDAKKVLETEVLKCKDRELKKESMEEYHRRKKEMAMKRQEHRKGNKKGGDTKLDKAGNSKATNGQPKDEAEKDEVEETKTEEPKPDESTKIKAE